MHFPNRSGISMMNSNAVQMISIENLLLDVDNPRLPEALNPRSQEKMIAYIAAKSAIEDLMSSIGKNGFFSGEALVAYHNPADGRNIYRVIEGNRRLTAVKLILDPNLYKTRSAIKELANEALNKTALKKLPVVVFASRKEVLPYLGSRHIVGVKQWEPLAKARYMRQLFDSQPKKKVPLNEVYRSVASQIGSYKRSDYIKKNLDGLAVYELIEGNDFFEIEGLSEETIDFGTLYTAIGNPAIAEYIGAAELNKKTEIYERFDPIITPAILKTDRVKKLAEWLYRENSEGERVVAESRDLPNLAKVLATPKARAQLESGAPLDTAYSYTTGINDDLLRQLQEARKLMRAANGAAPSVTPDNAIMEIAQELRDLSENLIATFERKAKRANR
jgi:ParB-like nuclease domain